MALLPLRAKGNYLVDLAADAVLFTPAILFGWSGFKLQTLLPFVEEHRMPGIGVLRLDAPWWKLPATMARWQPELWAIPLPFAKFWDDYLNSMLLRDSRQVFQIVPKTIVTEDPLFVSKRGWRPDAPRIRIQILELDSSRDYIEVIRKGGSKGDWTPVRRNPDPRWKDHLAGIEAQFKGDATWTYERLFHPTLTAK